MAFAESTIIAIKQLRFFDTRTFSRLLWEPCGITFVYLQLLISNFAYVAFNDEFAAVLDEIEHHRYPAKNALVIQISFKQGLRAQEMSLLRIREIAALSDEFSCGYKI